MKTTRAVWACMILGVAADPMSALATPPADIDAAIRAELGLTDYSIVDLDVPAVAGQGFMLAFDAQDQPFTLLLEPTSVRAPGFRVLVQQADGSLVDHPAPAPLTYRGNVLEMHDSVVTGSLIEGQFTGRILTPDQAWVIQPLTDILPAAARSAYVVYGADDVIPDGSRCGNDDIFDQSGAGLFRRPGVVGGHDHHDHAGPDLSDHADGDQWLDPAGIKEAEIAYDADFEFFQKNSSNVNTTIADIENVHNSINVIYERDVEIHETITTIIVRSNSADPYTSTDPGTLLGEFQDEWNTNQTGITRDLAHLMTGKNLAGGVIGVAYLGVVCNRSVAYGLSESRFTSNFNQRVGLSAHEQGHNWGAPHCCGGCSGCSSCRIMCPCLGGCSGIVTSFGPDEINSITNFRNSRSCLGDYSDFDLAVGTLIGGQPGQFDVTRGVPNASVRLYYSLVGEGDCFIADFNVTLDLANCIQAASGTTNAAGEKSWTLNIPRVRRATVVWFQSAQSGATSNLVLTQVNP